MKIPAKSQYLQIIGILVGIATIISLYIPYILNYTGRPALSYEINSYPVGPNVSIVCVEVRNEGRSSAEEVEINIKVDGQINNVCVQKGRITENIGQSELFEDNVDIRKNKSTCTIRVPYIAFGMQYIASLIVKPEGYQMNYGVVANSKNAGPAKKYQQKVGWDYRPIIISFLVGCVITVTSYWLIKLIRRYRRKKE